MWEMGVQLFWTNKWMEGFDVSDFAPSLLLKISPRILNKCTVWEALHNHRWLQDIAGMARSIRMNRFSWAPYGQFSTMSNLTMLYRMCFNVPVARIVLVVFVSFCAGYLTQLCQSSLSSSARQFLLSSLCEIYRSYLKNGLTMQLDVPIGCPCKKYCCGGYSATAPPASTRWSSICKGR